MTTTMMTVGAAANRMKQSSPKGARPTVPLSFWRAALVCALLLALAACSQPAAPPSPAGHDTLRPKPVPTPPAWTETKMIRLPGGTFLMGCVPADPNCEPNESPAHPVRVKPFWMDEHEVTAAQYDACIDAGVCKATQVAGTASGDLSSFAFNSRNVQRRDHPANGVNFFSARTYCAWVGKRLPTEAEYEYALRGGQASQIYPWGNDLPTTPVGNFADRSVMKHPPLQLPPWPDYDDGYVGTSPVCHYGRNAYGLCDLSGNVWEWCEGEVAGHADQHIVRGGSWHNNHLELRASARHPFISDGFAHVGLRCVSDRGPRPPR